MNSSDRDLGDITAGLAFEALEELNYNPWKPRALIFLDAILPTGRSVYESSEPLGADIHGRGFLSAHTGIFFWKVWDPWDASLLLTHRNSFSRRFEQAGSINPGHTLSAQLGLGFKPFRNSRIGFGIGPSYDSKIKINGARQENSNKLVWTVSSQVGITLSDDWGFNLTYSDQTLLGPTFNSTLSRGVQFAVNRNFEL